MIGVSLAPLKKVGEQYRGEFSAGRYQVSVITGPRWKEDNGRKARVYVDGEELVDFAPAHAAAQAAAAQIGHHPLRGEVAEVDAIFDALNRLVIKHQREAIEEAVAAVPELAVLLAGVKLGFSRTAGCSCPCSPGFVAKDWISAAYEGPLGEALNGNVSSIFITRKPEEAAA